MPCGKSHTIRGIVKHIGYNWNYFNAEKDQQQQANALDDYTNKVFQYYPPLAQSAKNMITAKVPGTDKTASKVNNIVQDLKQVSRQASFYGVPIRNKALLAKTPGLP